MATPHHRLNLLIASYLEPEHVERIRQVDDRLNVIYEPDLLRPPRYPADHTGAPIDRSPEQEARWKQLLSEADILFDFDQTHREDLPSLAPRVRWIQGTSAGIGQFVHQMAYDTRMPDTIFTTASGVHIRPLAEFCIMAMLMFNKGLLRMLRDQERKHWERYAGTDLAGRALLIIGMGKIGTEVARLARAFGMKVLGTKRRAKGIDPAILYLDELHPSGALHELLPRAEYLVLITPHTPETEGMIGARELGLLPQGSIFINIGRGAVVDEPALIEALRSGHLGGAALDVFAKEPLPQDSPLWEMPNVLVSPHSGSTSDRENRRLTDLFCENLRRFLDDEPLLNVLDTEARY
jgi:glyoxylate/hydroxypyruvate reductase